MENLQNKKPTAWMLRRDGAAFPVLQHIYGNPEDVEETLYAGQWLFDHTTRKSTRDLVLQLLGAYGMSVMPWRMNIARSIRLQLKKRPYRFVDDAFILRVAGDIPAVSGDLPSLCGMLCQDLNQQFTRVRLGGLYNSVPGNRNLYFRLSDDDPGWERILREFVRANRPMIETVTVVWDEESTGKADFVTDSAGQIWDHRRLEPSDQ